jgi:hypothetical protein
MTDMTIDPPVRWGIISTADIATIYVMTALQASVGHEVVAV